MAIEPTPQIPKNRRIDKSQILTPYRRFQKTLPSIGIDKTFIEEVWDDERFWNDMNVWGS